MLDIARCFVLGIFKCFMLSILKCFVLSMYGLRLGVWGSGFGGGRVAWLPVKCLGSGVECLWFVMFDL